jgi:Mn-dependent DtxR family transcriptional regulator
MSIELTDLKRYELELDNCLSIILAANRRDKELNTADLAVALHIDLATANKLVQKLKTENIIK